MKCPYCGKEMKRGIINGNNLFKRIKWVPVEIGEVEVFPIASKGIKLSNLLDGNSVVAFNCLDCKKIVIDVEDKIDQR